MSDTPLDVAVLRALPDVEAGTHLVGCSSAELHALALRLGLRVKRRVERLELVGQILAVTHPPATPTASPAPIFEQARFA